MDDIWERMRNEQPNLNKFLQDVEMSVDKEGLFEENLNFFGLENRPAFKFGSRFVYSMIPRSHTSIPLTESEVGVFSCHSFLHAF